MKGGVRTIGPIAAIVLLQLVAVYTLVLGLQRSLAERFTANAQITLNELADGAIDRTRRFLRPVHDAVSVGVELIDAGILDETDDAALEVYFTAQLAATPWLSGVFLGRADGSFVFVARNAGGLRTKRITVDAGKRVVELVQRDPGGAVIERWTDAEDRYDPRERAWYRLSQASDTIVWTDPYVFFSSGLPGISAAARSAEGLVLGADVELQELSAFIESIPHAESGTALILDETARAVARSGTDGLRAGSEGDDNPTLLEVAEAPLLALYESSEADRSGTDLIGIEIEHDTYLGLVRDFPIADNAPSWTLLAQMRADDYAGGALNFFNRQIVLLGVISLGLGALALGGALWLYQRSARRSDPDERRDPVTGALEHTRFTERLHARFSAPERLERTRRGVMVIEARGLRRLADRHGSACRDAVHAELARRLTPVLDDEDLFGLSRTGRFLLATTAESRAAMIARFERFHDALAAENLIATPCGPQVLDIASGAAVLEVDEPVENLLPRAREALALGLERGRSGCQMAAGLDAHALPRLVRAS